MSRSLIAVWMTPRLLLSIRPSVTESSVVISTTNTSGSLRLGNLSSHVIDLSAPGCFRPKIQTRGFCRDEPMLLFSDILASHPPPKYLPTLTCACLTPIAEGGRVARQRAASENGGAPVSNRMAGAATGSAGRRAFGMWSLDIACGGSGAAVSAGRTHVPAAPCLRECTCLWFHHARASRHRGASTHGLPPAPVTACHRRHMPSCGRARGSWLSLTVPAVHCKYLRFWSHCDLPS